MTTVQQEIIRLISKYMTENPELRFGQALFNLDVNHFKNVKEIRHEYEVADIYNDLDADILERIKARLKRIEGKK